MISKKKIQHIAQLARIKITKKEEKKFTKELSLVLGYFKQLKKVKTKNIQSADYLIFKMTEYKCQKKQVLDKNQDLLKIAPETKNDYLKIKSILKK